jgi:pSer/pThr/pTyr-binding forkhead associated (FHA) protein
LLWLFIYAMVRVIRTDLRTSGARRVANTPTAKRVKKAPSSEHRAPMLQLVVIEGELAGTRIALGDKPILLGRANDSTLVLTDDYASTRHARISQTDGVWFLEDLGSTNGTYVGQSKVSAPVALQSGVVIRIGRTAMELR